MPDCRLVLVWLACLASCVCCASAACADEPPGVPERTVPKLRTIVVPDEILSEYLGESAVPVQLGRLNSLIEGASRQTVGPARQRVDLAEYHATFVEHEPALVDGTLTAATTNTSPDRELLSLEPLSLALSGLTSLGKPAAWGLSPQGELLLQVEPGTQQFEGTWTLKGRRIHSTVGFDIRVMPATVSRLHLQIPPEYELRSSVGTVWAPEPVSQSQARTWNVDLGSQSECRIELRPRDEAKKLMPQVTYSVSSSIIAGQTGMQLTFDVNLDVYRAALEEFAVSLPLRVDVQSIGYTTRDGSDVPLQWTEEADESHRYFLVRLPGKLLEPSRRIRILATAPLAVSDRALIPKLNIRHSTFLVDDVILKIEKPLQLRDSQLDGYRQTAPLRMSADGEQFAFRRFRADGELSVDIGLPQLAISARILGRVECSQRDWTMNTTLQWSARSGSTFTTTSRIPTGWNITDVQPSAGATTSKLSNWQVLESDDGVRQLVCEFQEALAAESSKSVNVGARLLVPVGSEAIDFPVLVPQGCQDVDAIIAIGSSPGETPAVDAGSEFREIDAATVQEILGNELPAALVAGEPVIYYGGQVVDAGRLHLQRSQQRFELKVRTHLELGRGGIHQLFTLDVQPVAEPVDRVVVYLTEAGTPPLWQMVTEGEAPQGLTSVALHRHEDWDLPLEGELWEIRLPSATDRPFRISAVRTMSAAPSYRPALAFAPNVIALNAAVELVSHDAPPKDVTAAGLIAAELPSDGPRGPEGDSENAVWYYERPTASLEIAVANDADIAAIPAFSTCELRSLITPPGQGYDQHWARYSLDSTSVARGFRFRLPDSVELLGVTVDVGLVETTRNADRYTLIFDHDARPTELTIRYQVPASEGVFWQPVTVVLPEVEARVLEFRWLCGVPPGIRLGVLPAHFRSQGSSDTVSWYQRFLGPVGRATAESMFNPFVVGSWSEFFNPGPAPAVFPQNQESFPPKDWKLVEATGTDPPLQWEVAAWNRGRIRMLAWTVFFGTLAIACVCRSRRVSFRSELGIVCLVCAAVAAWFAPTVCAEVVGGFFGAIVIALLIPRRIIDRPVRPHPPAAHLGSTVSLRTAVGFILLASLVVLSSAGAQDPPSALPTPQQLLESPPQAGLQPAAPAASGPPTQPGSHVVLIPSSSRERGDKAIVYIDDKLLRWLESRQPLPNVGPDYLLSDAVYRSHFTAEGVHQIQAVFDVVVLSDRRAVRIDFLFEGMVVGGSRPCLVDGQPGTIVKTDATPGFSVELPEVSLPGDSDSPVALDAARRYRVELTLIPLSATGAANEPVDITLPALASNRWELHSKAQASPARIGGGLGFTRETAFGRVVELGRTGNVTVLTSASTNESAGGDAQLRLYMLLEAAPGRCDVHLETQYEVTAGTVDYLIWEVGPSTIVHRVLDENGSNVPFQWIADGTLKLMIPLHPARNAGSRFILSADLTLPASYSNGTISIPPLLASAPADSPSLSSIRVAEVLVGLTAANGFQLDAQAPLSGEIQPLAPEQFVLPVSRVENLRKPQLAFRSAAPAAFQFELQPVIPEQQLQYFSQEGRIRKNRLEWTVQAEIETSAAGTFEHRLYVDPRLRIESISVQADEAERLVRWSRFDDRLIVHLSQKTAASQDLVIKGSMPLALDETTRLPDVRFDGASPIASDLRLFRDDVSRFELVERDELTAMEANAEPAPEGSTETLLGRYRLPRESAVLHVRPYVEEEPPLSSTVTVLEARPGDLWSIRTLVRFERQGKRMLPCRVHLPTEIAANYDLQPSDAISDVEPDRAGDAADGSLTLLLHPRTQSVEAITAIITAGPFPADAPQWTVPVVGTPLSANQNSYLIVVPQGHWRPAGSEVATLSESVLPEWAIEHPFVRELQESPVPQIEVFRRSGSDWHLERADDRTADSEPRIVHLETRIEIDDAGRMKGRSTLLAALPVDTPLVLNWPDGTTLDVMFVDGRVAPAPEPSKGTLEIPAEAVAVVRRITLIWNRQEQHSPLLAGRIAAVFPVPRDIATDRSLLEFLPAARHESAKMLGMPVADELTFLTHRFEGLLEFQQRAIEVTGTVEPVCWAILTELHSVLSRRFGTLKEQVERSTAPRLNARFRERESLYRTVEAAADASRTAREATAEVTAEAAMIQAEFLAARSGGLRQTVLGVAQNQPATNIVSFLVFDRRAAVFVLALLAVGVVVPILRRILTPHLGAWLSIHDSVAWALLGILWWTCLTPSFVGMLLLIPAAVHAYRRRRHRMRESTAYYAA